VHQTDMKPLLPLLTTSFLLAAGTVLFAQEPAPAPAPEESTRARAADDKKDGNVTYGRIKEFTAGQKVVINVDNAPDKTFDLTDKNMTVKLPSDLKVGDTIKVTEQNDALGKTKSAEITKHTGGGVPHGDPAKKP
jgi:hypothetical protein